MKFHSSLNYVTEEQFIHDITWLFNALKQALGDGKGADIILLYAESFDGIAVYHTMINRYRYGGDMQTYKTKQETILSTNFSRGYPGGPLTYLDEWEKAAVRLAFVSKEEALSDDTKRSRFSQRFTILGYTDTLVDSILDSTSTWYQFSDLLRQRLARRQAKEDEQATTTLNANHIGTTNEDLSVNDHARI